MYQYFKRLVDVFVAVFLLLLLSPIFIFIFIVLLLTGEHEVFYSQYRIGYKNRKFKILKFVTMLKDSPNMGNGSITLRGDPRVTTVGRFLRKSKLNELPQLFNILIGDMTLVGPRPHMDFDFNHYPEEIKKIIFNIKPGVTGIGSVVFRDQESIFTLAKVNPHKYYKKYIAPYKGELEIWYQNNLSAKTDFLILFLTAWVIFFSESELAYTVFKTLPPKIKFPRFDELTEEEKLELR